MYSVALPVQLCCCNCVYRHSSYRFVFAFFGKFMVVEFWLCKTWKVQLQKMQATPKLILKILWLVCLGVMYISTIEIQLTVLQRYNRIVDATFIFPNSFLFWNCSESLVLSEWSSKQVSIGFQQVACLIVVGEKFKVNFFLILIGHISWNRGSSIC
jgi:hypothetical protein